MKMKYTDNIQILVFAYTSIFKHLLGNMTTEPPPQIFLDVFFHHSKVHLFLCLTKTIIVQDSLFDDRNVAFSVENKFGSLRFVSCGSRGYEYLHIKQLVLVFEISIWKWLLAFSSLLLVTMSLLRGSMCSLNLTNKFTCLLKVLLEQGDPFPARYIKSKPFRFLICGTLLGGLVLSNAFKSNNVYNIVLPMQRLKFGTIDELLQHGFTVYTQISHISYPDNWKEVPKNAVMGDVKDGKLLKIYSTTGKWMMHASTEISTYHGMTFYASDELIEKERSSLSMLRNISVPHIGLYDIIVEPLKVLRPLVENGQMHALRVAFVTQEVNFLKKQAKFIENDPRKCNKSAWILPDYRAQQLTRMLYQWGKHSDVGVTKYLNTRLNLRFDGLVSSTSLQRASMVPSTGLLKWWSDLINRTDLKRHPEIDPPVKPNMSGNIQTIFYMLLGGMLIAQVSMILELHEFILRYSKLHVTCVSLLC